MRKPLWFMASKSTNGDDCYIKSNKLKSEFFLPVLKEDSFNSGDDVSGRFFYQIYLSFFSPAK